MIIGEPLYLLLIVPFALVANLLPGGTVRAWCFRGQLRVLLHVLIVTCPGPAGCAIIAFAGGLLIERSATLGWRGWLTGSIIALCLSPLVIYQVISSRFFRRATPVPIGR